MNSKNETPLQRQYKQIKNKYPNTILLYRVGDFYETFYDDASIAADICGIVLTKRGDMPLAGFPYHQLDIYLTKVISQNQDFFKYHGTDGYDYDNIIAIVNTHNNEEYYSEFNQAIESVNKALEQQRIEAQNNY